MTIDELAAISQHEFQNLRREMATKEDLRESQSTILRAIETLDLHLANYASRWDEDFERLDKCVQDLDHRMALFSKCHT